VGGEAAWLRQFFGEVSQVSTVRLELDRFVLTQYANIDGTVRVGDTMQAYGWGRTRTETCRPG
ncbi:hypothetical protein, partial [Amycolatopsis cihanbeyliensis]